MRYLNHMNDIFKSLVRYEPILMEEEQFPDQYPRPLDDNNLDHYFFVQLC